MALFAASANLPATHEVVNARIDSFHWSASLHKIIFDNTQKGLFRSVKNPEELPEKMRRAGQRVA